MLFRAILALGFASVAFGEGPVFCGVVLDGGAPPMINYYLNASCVESGATISSVLFASYGTPDVAVCGSFAVGACNSPNSSAIVSAACLNEPACSIGANTTTFGDSCFGTVKQLAVEMRCSSGNGVAGAYVPPTPEPPPVSNYTAKISVTWATPAAAPLRIEPSVQVVSQHLLWRDSPIHDASFASLASLGARNVRFVPWIPYPAYGVAELDPPSGALLCGPAAWVGGQSATEPIALDCGAGHTIASVDFASFGKASGVCGAYAATPACDAANSGAVVRAACVGKQSCSFLPTDFGPPPCSGAYLAAQVRCDDFPVERHTYYNFTKLDAFFLDFWAAVNGDETEPIPNFSTQPTWLYSPQDFACASPPPRRIAPRVTPRRLSRRLLQQPRWLSEHALSGRSRLSSSATRARARAR